MHMIFHRDEGQRIDDGVSRYLAPRHKPADVVVHPTIAGVSARVATKNSTQR